MASKFHQQAAAELADQAGPKVLLSCELYVKAKGMKGPVKFAKQYASLLCDGDEHTISYRDEKSKQGGLSATLTALEHQHEQIHTIDGVIDKVDAGLAKVTIAARSAARLR